MSDFLKDLHDLDGSLPEHIDGDALRLLLFLEQKYQIVCDKLDTVIEHGTNGATIKLQIEGEKDIDLRPGNPLRDGVILGMRLARRMDGSFPVKIQDPQGGGGC